MLTDAGVDTGAMLLRRETDIGEVETAAELSVRLSQLGAELLIETLKGYIAGEIAPTPQDERLASRQPMLNKEMGRIDWTKSAREIACQARGLDPWPSAYTNYAGGTLKIYRAPSPPRARARPARVLRASAKEGLFVGPAGEGALEVWKCRPPAGKRMSARAYLGGQEDRTGNEDSARGCKWTNATKENTAPREGRTPPGLPRPPRAERRRKRKSPSAPAKWRAARFRMWRAPAPMSRRRWDRHLNTTHLSADDKRLAASLFFTAVENRLLLEARLSGFWTERPEPVVEDIPPHRRGADTFDGQDPRPRRRGRGREADARLRRDGLSALVNGILRNLIRARDAGELAEITDPAVRYSVAPELAKAPRRPPTAMRRPRPSWPTAPAPSQDHPLQRHEGPTRRALKITSRRTMSSSSAASSPARTAARRRATSPRLDGFRNGYFSIQGESSMLAALAVEPKPGMNVLDACAAPGGKSALIAETMADVGRVYAWDVHEHRVELIRAAKQRLRLDSLRPRLVRDARKPYADFDLYMDAVLVDAPCSGLGVIADKPDIKYPLHRRAAGIAAALAGGDPGKLRPASSGRAGCSSIPPAPSSPRRNEQQVRAFLAKHPEFVPETSAGLPARTSALPLRRRHGAVFEPPRPRGGLLHRPHAQKGRVAWSARSFSR